MLGHKLENITWDDEGEKAIAKTEASMTKAGFAPLAFRGNYFVSSTEKGKNVQSQAQKKKPNSGKR